MRRIVKILVFAGTISVCACSSIPASSPSLDLRTVETKEQVEILHKQGALQKVYLFPLEMGGKDVGLNIVFLPKAAAQEKEAFDVEVISAAERGEINRYKADPEYQGKSLVPSKISIVASGSSSLQKVISVY